MSKKILIFDMDGVLLKPRGYHQALKDTVCLVAEKMGFEGISLSDQDIAQFEGLGISSEWHSSAACMALLVINGHLHLSQLFKLLKGEQAQVSARIRLENAIRKRAEAAEVEPDEAVLLIQKSETEESMTHRVFQEMILGTADKESYLLKYDEPVLGSDSRKKLLIWLEHPEHRCVVMTNRPSHNMPDANYGLQLIGMKNSIPLVGYGEMERMAEIFGGDAAEYSKPSSAHALAAALAALGIAENLHITHNALNGRVSDLLTQLDDCQFWVFEDSPAGIVSVDAMGRFLATKDISVKVNKIGIAESSVKGAYLEKQGAQIFGNINVALGDILN